MPLARRHQRTSNEPMKLCAKQDTTTAISSTAKDFMARWRRVAHALWSGVRARMRRSRERAAKSPRLPPSWQRRPRRPRVVLAIEVAQILFKRCEVGSDATDPALTCCGVRPPLAHQEMRSGPRHLRRTQEDTGKERAASGRPAASRRLSCIAAQRRASAVSPIAKATRTRPDSARIGSAPLSMPLRCCSSALSRHRSFRNTRRRNRLACPGNRCPRACARINAGFRRCVRALAGTAQRRARSYADRVDGCRGREPDKCLAGTQRSSWRPRDSYRCSRLISTSFCRRA